MLLADIHILHQSDIYKIVNYTCHCTVCSISDAEYSDNFSISFVKKGFFEYRTFRRNEEVHTGRILISKPGYEHTTRHIDQQPDITTTIEFKKDFFRELCEKYDRGAEWFFTNYDIHSILVSSNAELEYLYYYILKKIKVGNTNTLELDELDRKFSTSRISPAIVIAFQPRTSPRSLIDGTIEAMAPASPKVAFPD